ncbi:hypothetical protein MJL33_29625, partial [Salmonella enterica subsp. enterica serovar Kentucky]|nr:hypothetical protein [Salmonella enterica subsp. enterica serovar Kentucky]
DAYNSIGWMYKCGHGVEQNYSLALEWFHKSAECNNSSGWYNLDVILMVGVNGVGKTTTIGKLARQFEQQGKSVMLAAGDTFRAAA